jgi:hypothetical protein
VRGLTIGESVEAIAGIDRAAAASAAGRGLACWGIVTEHHSSEGATSVAKPNYAYEKRQRELEKKRKKEEKAQKKTVPGSGPGGGTPTPGGDAPPPA